MPELTAIIADIQRASVHDGPGIRTTVFFKGCPLRCAWCHNPECIAPQPQTLSYPEKCIGCGQCARGCFSGARVHCGEEMTQDALMEQLLLDRDYYAHGGGVTFSGGEPFMQAEFLSAIIDRCHALGIHTAVETSLAIYREPILRKLDLIMADLKCWNEHKHLAYIGVSASAIRQHFARASRLGVPIIARTPIVPGVNDSPQEIAQIAEFLGTLDNIVAYELLPYHPLGEGKRRALGMPQNQFHTPSQEVMEELKHYADLCGSAKKAARDKA